ncbi:spore protease YyaC [Clostridium beijerinckii]|uniref:spore protease YyaC n=1 Tax=Clostridium beijerinckii TaxID=1520 RepID=UPI00080A2B88|nr:spore protease YyaC [Clostridium beijerinckii]OCB00781.1 spore protease YyaC [Clostridium beijerinckii]
MSKPDIKLDPKFYYNLALEVKKFISKDTIIVCIGTDKCIGDCLGPLVGSILTENFFPLPVYGTLSSPIHALNIDERLNEIYSNHPNASIIGVDACLGDEDDIGEIRIRDYAIHPGKGVGKELPEVGIASVIGIVDSSENAEFFFSRSIRLSFIMDMAKIISKIFIDAYSLSHGKYPKI